MKKIEPLPFHCSPDISFFFLFLFISFITLTGISQVSAEEEVTVLMSQDISVYRDALDGFKKIYTGKIKVYDLNGDLEGARRLIPEINRNPGDLIVSIGLLATQAARERIKHTPILFCMVYYPERFPFFSQDMTGVRLEVSLPETFTEIKRLFPDIKRVGVLYDPKKTGKIIVESGEIAKGLGLFLIPIKISSEKELPEGLRSLAGKIDLLWMIPDSTVINPATLDAILLSTFKNNIPTFSFTDEFVMKGSVAALTSDYKEIGEEVGRIALKVLEGDLPVHFPIHSVTKNHLYVNLKVARKMELKLNPEIVQKAFIVNE